ncbi:PREDICTED: uncharacterized protein LOC109583601 [Amphimedon queenslandica]|uniref:Endonuclease/exonuclease/phosphatase domain-containing protein n=1 Tax=Amphimedon queenslandica TaxID=400682 RepID=A0A1X7UFF7_AMPQE|nr:PREDICTED: uncharacterized protein LOC109583601 [Amphimedon queenslandica]|eukprot:XP_019854575.1 PREDICTED: uncharacterized protein LOC109583601 [Amphimedon queenslandica]
MDKEILPYGYTIFRHDRDSRGGGVMIAVADSIQSNLIQLDYDIEMITVSLFNAHVSLSCLYIAPNSSEQYRHDTLKCLNRVVSDTSLSLVIGDFNSPDINWATLSASSPFSLSLCDFIFSHNLNQLVLRPTHVRGNILDLVLTNQNNRIDTIQVDDSVCSAHSDHSLILFSIGTNSKRVMKPNKRVIFDYTKADLDNLHSYLLGLHPPPACDVNSVWYFLKDSILMARSLFIPSVHRTPRTDPPWFTKEIRHSLKCLRSLHRRYHHHPTSHLSSRISSLESSTLTHISSAN